MVQGDFMFNMTVNLAKHIAPFMTLMAQIVTIWGFLNFINRLNLQNLTLVADRALGRLPELRNAIFVLQSCSKEDLEAAFGEVSEINKRLHMDLKQLGIAKDYNMHYRVSILSRNYTDLEQARKIYLKYEIGDDFHLAYKSSSMMIVPFIQKLENKLLSTFDLSRSKQAFGDQLLINVIRVSWFSLVIYLMECNKFFIAGCFLTIGLAIYFVKRWNIKASM